MPLQLIWRSGEVVLLLKLENGETTEERVLAEKKLDFELTPRLVTSVEERERFSSILSDLQARGGVEKNDVDVLIPAAWGHTLKLQDPFLEEEEMEEHLLWELSKNLLESTVQYQYNYRIEEDGVIHVAVIRRRLLEAIRRTVDESGFTLRGVFFQEAPYSAIDLTRTLAPATAPHRKPAEKSERTAEQMPRRPRGAEQPAWFLPVLLVVAAVVLIAFFWWRSTREKPVSPTRPPEEKTTSPTQPQMQDREPSQTEEPISPIEEPPALPTQPSPAKAWTGMNGRMALLQKILGETVDRRKFDLLSFTAAYFLLEISAPDSVELESIFRKVEQLPGITIDSKQRATTFRGGGIGTICGKIETGSALQSHNPPNPEQIFKLAGKHGLSHKEMIFTGSYEPIVQFAADCAELDFAVYRMILIPWKDQQYRIVFEP